MEPRDLRRFYINQQDSGLLRQIRLITSRTSKFNPYIIFVHINTGKQKPEYIKRIVSEGFVLNGHRFAMSERSASMTRNGILSFVDESIAEELDRRVTMDITFDKIILSKYHSYRGLLLSACHLIEDWLPKIIIVPDYYRIVPQQHIKFAFDETTEFIDKEGNKREWTQKNIGQDVRDIEICAFDGCGIHHPAISRQLEELIGSKTPMTSILLRLPYIKGVSNEIDYEAFYKAHGITQIQDIWGVWHDFSEPMMILTQSMYKGYSFFKTYGDERDWDLYWERFHKYQHCFGVAKWNFTAAEEPTYTRGNYQILQDLDLDYDTFRTLADDSIEWVNKIINGDRLYTYCFLGMLADSHKPENDYVRAILKNPEMMKETSVRKYISGLLNKYCDMMKAGKIWLKATFKFLTPDLIMLLEWIGGLEPRGCLEADEFYSHNLDGPYIGEYLIERNPHICKSEHCILRGTQNELINIYCSHLDNVCMINSKSITPQRLNGADYPLIKSPLL